MNRDCAEEGLCLRPATIKDAALLLRWRNDKTTRMASHSTEPVQLDAHIEWLDAALADKERSLFVAEEDGVPVGTVRADLANGAHELSWTVSPEARGRGVGKRMVKLLAGNIEGPIRAEIRQGRLASIRVAEYSGMVLIKEDGDGVLHYLRE